MAKRLFLTAWGSCDVFFFLKNNNNKQKDRARACGISAERRRQTQIDVLTRTAGGRTGTAGIVRKVPRAVDNTQLASPFLLRFLRCQDRRVQKANSTDCIETLTWAIKDKDHYKAYYYFGMHICPPYMY
jgi:hypothetical protein